MNKFTLTITLLCLYLIGNVYTQQEEPCSSYDDVHLTIRHLQEEIKALQIEVEQEKPKPFSSPCLDLLTNVLYYESRGETYIGKLAIANVIMNRVNSTDFPNTIPDVITQDKQFSYLWDLTKEQKPSNIIEYDSYDECRNIAYMILSKELTNDVTNGSTHYYNTKAKKPYWSKKLEYKKTIGKHRFYYGK